MNRFKVPILTFVLVCLTGWGVYAVGQKVMSVQVKQGCVRSTPSFLGKIVASLAYGDRVDVLEEKDPWAKICVSGKKCEGWMHVSALTNKKIVLKAGAEDVEKAASSDEVALAGKGFNEQVEGEFKKKNPKIDFAWVDKMEKIVVSQNAMQTFLKEGGVNPEGGAQ
ncbi:MAG: SH3 domain-containing protein [Deltaproteobacteria bacterium]|nr:SH3 domain-containing protein [Deltaproteobacteria bacterium]